MYAYDWNQSQEIKLEAYKDYREGRISEEKAKRILNSDLDSPATPDRCIRRSVKRMLNSDWDKVSGVMKYEELMGDVSEESDEELEQFLI